MQRLKHPRIRGLMLGDIVFLDLPIVSARLLLLMVYLCFISIGLPDAVMGTAWPEVRRSLALPLESISFVVMTFTLCGALSGFLAAPVIARLGTGRLAALSCALTGLALLGYSHAPSLTWLVLMAAPLGLGCGAVDSGLNHFVAERYSAKHMNWLHGCWGVGAMLGPLTLGAAIAGPGWRAGVFWIGGVQLMLAVVLLASLRLWLLAPEPHSTNQAVQGTAQRVSPTNTPSRGALFLAPLGFFFYVAAESGVGLWLASYLVERRQLAASLAAVWVAVYFGAIMLGRFAVGLVADRWGNRRLVRMGAILALLGTVLFISSSVMAVSALALALIGLGLAPIYPSLMHEASRRFSTDWAQRVIGWQAGTAYLGMAICPPLMAGLVAAYGLGIVFPVIACLLLLLWGSTEVLNSLT
jgi:fucose permease